MIGMLLVMPLALILPLFAGEKKPKGRTFLDEFQSDTPPPSGAPRLFLDEFLAVKDPPIIAKEVRFPSALGQVRGFWARPKVKEPLPAVLIAYDEELWAEWMAVNARHLASIGYEVLAVNLHERHRAAARSAGAGFADEAALAELSAAVRWLRGRSGIIPNRLGVAGWGWSGGQALVLASATSVQACVVIDAPLPVASNVLTGLRQTPVLAVVAAGNKATRDGLFLFRKRLEVHQAPCKIHEVDNVHPGFMGPPGAKAYAHDAAEDTWVVIYHFLEKHVEDARQPGPPAVAGLKPVATIADIMRAVCEPAGVRGALGKGLAQPPGTRKEWQRVRANAALIAEAGRWLEQQSPPKGSADHWGEQARAFTAAAEAIANAADKLDLPTAQAGLTRLATKCAACHLEHR